MQGEFRADVTRDSFDELRQVRRVLFHQGGVLVDAHLNEQVSVLLTYLEKLAEDIIGPHGGPTNRWGFKINNVVGSTTDFKIGVGRYYIDGVLCENAKDCKYESEQPDYAPDQENELAQDGTYLVYLDVFERSVAAPIEPALGNVEPTSRARLVWQVKAMKVKLSGSPLKIENVDLGDLGLTSEEKIVLFEIARRSDIDVSSATNKFRSAIRLLGLPAMNARARQDSATSTPCLLPAEARYRGPENQLYRVEIHQSGLAQEALDEPPATIKWSRENSSVVFPVVGDITSANGLTTVEVAHLGRDAKLCLSNDDWVEVVTDEDRRHARPGQLLRVLNIDRDRFQVTLNGLAMAAGTNSGSKHPILLRWDHQGEDLVGGGIPVKEGDVIALEDGIEITFEKAATGNGHWYRSGDYWLIPARVATGDIEWPRMLGADGSVNLNPDKFPNGSAQGPHGVVHHYAPLAFVKTPINKANDITDLRKKFDARGTP